MKKVKKTQTIILWFIQAIVSGIISVLVSRHMNGDSTVMTSTLNEVDPPILNAIFWIASIIAVLLVIRLIVLFLQILEWLDLGLFEDLL